MGIKASPWSGVKALRARSAAEGGAAAACKCRGMCSQQDPDPGARGAGGGLSQVCGV